MTLSSHKQSSMVDVRQETDGPQTEQLEGRGAESCPDERSKTTDSSSSKSRRPSQLYLCRRDPQSSKGRGHHLTVSDISYPQASSLEAILAKRCVQTRGRTLRYTNYGLRTRQSKMTGQKKPGKNAPYKLPQGRNSFSVPAHVSMHAYSFSS